MKNSLFHQGNGDEKVRGVDVPVWGLCPLTYFFTFEAIFFFNQWRGILISSAPLLHNLMWVKI